MNDEEKCFRLCFIVDSAVKRERLHKIFSQILNKDNLISMKIENGYEGQYRFKNNVIFDVISKSDSNRIHGMRFTAFVDLCECMEEELYRTLKYSVFASQYKL